MHPALRMAIWLLVSGAIAALGGCGSSDSPASSDAASNNLDASDSLSLGDAADTSTVSDTQTCVKTTDIAAPKDWGSKPNLPTATACNSGLGWIPPKLPAMSHDDGTPATTLPKQNWKIAGSYVMNDHPTWEAVRFDVEKPSRVWGFSIQWAVTPTDDAGQAATELAAGLYPDFSDNGFDFYRWDPLWQGSRCQGDATKDPLPSQHGEGWLDYALPEPLIIDQPKGLYVAHLRKTGADPAFAMDGSAPENCADPQNCCNAFTACHSAWNLPELQNFTMSNTAYYNWNGVSSSLDRDFLVRLWVEEIPADTTKVFKAVEGIVPGGRQSFGDYDNDGDDDLLMGGPLLYRNDAGKFTDITKTSGLSGGCSGGVWGDFDNDGCADLFCYIEDFSTEDSLWKGDCKGTFSNVTVASGISGKQSYNTCKDKGTHAPSAGAGWADLDGDGLLDLYVSRFQCWDDYTPYADTVFHNLGGGKFENWTGSKGFLGEKDTKTPSRGVVPVDADQDGDMDIFVNNYVLIRNLFYRNDGDTFAEVGQKNGLAGVKNLWSSQTYYGHSIGAVFGDLNGDGLLDAVVANLAHPRFFIFSNKTQVLLQDSPGHWSDLQGAWTENAKSTQPKQQQGGAGLRYQETHSVPALGDFDNDGDLDLAISAVYDGRPTDFYWGNGDGTFSIDRARAGISSRNGWSMAVADIDNDGDLDLAAQGEMLRNVLPCKGNWLQVRLVGDGGSNRMGLGATVKVFSGETSWLRYVSGGNGQGGQDSATLHFGVATTSTIDKIEVRWIGGEVTTYAGPFATNQRLWLYQTGKIAPGWAPPAK